MLAEGDWGIQQAAIEAGTLSGGSGGVGDGEGAGTGRRGGRRRDPTVGDNAGISIAGGDWGRAHQMNFANLDQKAFWFPLDQNR